MSGSAIKSKNLHAGKKKNKKRTPTRINKEEEITRIKNVDKDNSAAKDVSK